MKLVPAEPTEEMLVAGQEAWACRKFKSALEDCEEARAVYLAMVEAAEPGVPSAWLFTHRNGLRIPCVNRASPFNDKQVEGIDYNVTPLFGARAND